MELGKVIESNDEARSSAAAHPPDAALRELPPPSPSSKTLDGSRPPSVPNGNSHADARQSRSPSDVWAGAISRLRTDTSYNLSMLQSHHHQITNLEQSVGQLRADMGGVFAMLEDIRAELRARPAADPPPRHDPGDLEVLATQMAVITSKANEIDGLKMQVDLMRNRLRRFEDQHSPSAVPPRTATASSAPRDSYEPTPVVAPPPPPPPPPPPQQQPPYQQLPPLRMSNANVMSPPGERAHTPSAVPLPVQPPSLDSRMTLAEPAAVLPAAVPGFRTVEPPAAPQPVPGWRPAEFHHASGVPPPPPHAAPPYHSHPVEPEQQAGMWATVNVHPSVKRPFDEPQPSPYEVPSAPGSPKRPRLIKPRNSYGSENTAPTPPSVPQPAPPAVSDGSFRASSRAPSENSQTQTQATSAPAPANTNALRFVMSTAQPDAQDPWRAETEHLQHPHHQGARAGRGRGGRGGRGGRSKGRGGHHPDHHHDTENLGTPEPDWAPSQLSPPNGHYELIVPPGGFDRRAAGAAGGAPDREQHGYPITPAQAPHDAFVQPIDGTSGGSGGKKTRTKPSRNADGVLIRKDGRPDMRSVSSANNLRKVHAKKEAERAEIEGRTPITTRSLAPARSNSSDEGGTRSNTPGSATGGEADDQDADERHQKYMSKLFPDGIEGAEARVFAGNYFPRRKEPLPESEMVAKREEDNGAENGPSGPDAKYDASPRDSQMTNSDIPPHDHAPRAEEVDEAKDVVMAHSDTKDIPLATVEAPLAERPTAVT